MIAIKLDVAKLDKARFFQGAKGLYADIMLFETPNGEFGDFLVKQQCTKEEREAKVQMPILGNAKWIGQKPASATGPQATRPVPSESLPGDPSAVTLGW